MNRQRLLVASLATALVGIILACGGAGPGPGNSKEHQELKDKYEKIESGMSLEQVRGIMGRPEDTAEIVPNTGGSTLLTWTYADGDWTTMVAVQFNSNSQLEHKWLRSEVKDTKSVDTKGGDTRPDTKGTNIKQDTSSQKRDQPRSEAKRKCDQINYNMTLKDVSAKIGRAPDEAGPVGKEFWATWKIKDDNGTAGKVRVVLRNDKVIDKFDY